MSYDYAALRDDTVFPLIQHYGTPLTLSRIEDTAIFVKSYDPVQMVMIWTNQNTGEVVYTEPESVVKTYQGETIITRYRNEEIDGTTIKRGDRRLLAIGIPEPKSGDILTVNGVEYSYIFSDPIAPGGVAVAYRIQVRV